MVLHLLHSFVETHSILNTTNMIGVHWIFEPRISFIDVVLVLITESGELVVQGQLGRVRRLAAVRLRVATLNLFESEKREQIFR